MVLLVSISGGIGSCSAYIEAGKHLTKATVSVRGYYRKDGTYVRPYYRRPPGGAQHDRPYEAKRSIMGLLFLICLVGGISYTSLYYSISKQQTDDFIREYKAEQKRKKTLEILEKLNYNFSDLTKLPKGLNFGGTSHKCKFCNTYLFNEDFYISFRAIKREHFVCINCVKTRSSLGRGQPSSKYFDAVKYTTLFEHRFNEFLSRFREIHGVSDIFYSEEEIKEIFLNEIKRNISN